MGNAELRLIRNDQWEDVGVNRKKKKKSIKKYTPLKDLIIHTEHGILLHDTLKQKSELERIGIQYLDPVCSTLNRLLLSNGLDAWELRLLQVVWFKTKEFRVRQALKYQYFWTSGKYLSAILNINRRTVNSHIIDRGVNSLQDRGWIQLAGRYPMNEEGSKNLKPVGIQLTVEAGLIFRQNAVEWHKILEERKRKNAQNQ